MAAGGNRAAIYAWDLTDGRGNDLGIEPEQVRVVGVSRCAHPMRLACPEGLDAGEVCENAAAALRHRPLLQLLRNDERHHPGAAGREVGPALDVRLQGR